MYHPIKEHHQERATGDICTCRKGVGEIRVRWPDCCDHILKISTPLNSCDCCPLTISEASKCTDHQGDESSDQNCRNTPPHTERHTGSNRERDVVHSTNSTIGQILGEKGVPGKTNNATANKETKEADGNCLTSCEAYSHNCGDSRPKRRSEHVTAPYNYSNLAEDHTIVEVVPYSPCTKLHRYRIEILVTPARISSITAGQGSQLPVEGFGLWKAEAGAILELCDDTHCVWEGGRVDETDPRCVVEKTELRRVLYTY